MTPKTPPATCAEAAARFQEWADTTPYHDERLRHNARAEVLAAFGDAPVPAAVLNEWDFTR